MGQVAQSTGGRTNAREKVPYKEYLKLKFPRSYGMIDEFLKERG